MKIHMVKKGESLYSISQKYNVPLEELIKANPEIANPDAIDVGMKVKIPAAPKPAYEVMHQHKVQQGDTLWKLSKAWGIPLADMIQANPQLKNPNVLLTGETVNIPKLPSAGPAGNPGQSGGHHWLPGVPQWIPGKKGTGVKPETGAAIQPAPEAELPAPLPLPAPVQMPPVAAAPLPPILQMPENVMPENVMPANVMPANVMPANVMPANVMPANVMPANVMPENVMSAPFMPAAENVYPMPFPENVYPLPYKPDHDLFMQYPVPAVEAGANAPYPSHAALPNEPAFGYGPTYGNGYGHGTVEGAIGSVYDPHDISGHGYGDISQTGAMGVQGVTGYLPAYVPGLVAPSGAAGKPSGGCDTCGGKPAAVTPAFQAPAAPPVWPQVPSVPVWPAAPAGPTAVSPAATGFFPGTAVNPMFPAAPGAAVTYPAAGMMPMAPEVPVTYPAAGMMPMAPEVPVTYPVTGTLPAYGIPEQAALPYVYGGYPSAVAPFAHDGYPHVVSPYTHDDYPHAVSPFMHDGYPHAVSPFMHDGYPHMVSPYMHDGYPHAVSPYGFDGYPHAGIPIWPAVSAGAVYPGAVPYCPPVSSDGIPPIPPLRDEEGPDAGEPSLNLHASDEEPDRVSPKPAGKRPSAKKAKSAPARRSSPKRKESLPWIQW